MTVFDSVWLYLTPITRFTLYDAVWHCMTLYDSLWLCLTLYDSVLLYMSLYESVLLCMTLYDSVRHCMTLFDFPHLMRLWTNFALCIMHIVLWILYCDNFFCKVIKKTEALTSNLSDNPGAYEWTLASAAPCAQCILCITVSHSAYYVTQCHTLQTI